MLSWIAKQPLCGHCFAIARNDEAAFESPSGSQREPAPLAGSTIYNHGEDTFILSALYIYLQHPRSYKKACLSRER